MEPMRSKETQELINIYDTIMDKLASAGITPAKQILDNEAPKEYLKAIKKQQVTWELVPLHNHQCNLAEKVIQTSKGHIIANILGCDDSYPTREWHRLLPQIKLTLNMLCPANACPTISAHSYVYGIHDYNKTPLAPLGCATQCYVGPDQCRSFGGHSMDLWYVKTSPYHYRCHKLLIHDTKTERITDTVHFKHKRIKQPSTSIADAIVTSAMKLTQAITTNMKTSLADLNLHKLDRLATIFNKLQQKSAIRMPNN
eukprot:CCRYP_007089-RA/>CCRYP_007089-RA protein AED:0.34 eAED:0.34 QI:0/-1/0/1/-1/1/1/0/255